MIYVCYRYDFNDYDYFVSFTEFAYAGEFMQDLSRKKHCTKAEIWDPMRCPTREELSPKKAGKK